jgi:hypothetical protein
MSGTDWVDYWLGVLIDQVFRVDLPQCQAFEPTPAFYANLVSGDEGDAARAAQEIGRFLLLPVIPSVMYEWGIRVSPQTAGQIHIQQGRKSHIQIPLYYVGKPHALGAILAHELTHERLASTAGVTYASVEEMERVTDLASVVLGLGKLVLNGLITEVAPPTGERQVLGYLAPDAIAYAYLYVTRRCGITEDLMRRNLTDAAVALVCQAP